MRANRLHDTISPPSIVCWSRPELISWCTARLMLMLGCGGRHTCILNCPLHSSRHHHPALPPWVAMMHPWLSAPWPDYEVCRALNVFSSKQLNFSPTTIKLWKGVETLDKCNSYSLKIPLKPKLCDEEKVKQAWNVFGFKMEISELAFVWTWFCFKVVYFHAFKELPWIWIRFFTHFVFASKKAISDEIWWCIEHLESQIKWDFLNNTKERRGTLRSTQKYPSSWTVTFYWSLCHLAKFWWTSLHIDEDVWTWVHKIR